MKNKQTISLLWRFLKGAKRYFLVTILAAGITALADMLQPQIIRAAIDCALGGQEGDFPIFVTKLVDRIGGFAYLGQHLWIMALAVLIVALVQVISQYAFRVYNTKASETLVKTMRDQLFSHIQRIDFFVIHNRTQSRAGQGHFRRRIFSLQIIHVKGTGQGILSKIRKPQQR